MQELGRNPEYANLQDPATQQKALAWAGSLAGDNQALGTILGGNYNT